MSNLAEKICLIIPCYNESSRLNIAEFLQSPSNISFIFVNDGSTDNTVDIIKINFLNKDSHRFHLLDLKQNVGKGEAVRQGFLYIEKKSPAFENIKWVGYWDADLATPLSEVNQFIAYASLYQNAEIILGCRLYRLGSNIQRNFTRHICGRFFATLISLIFNLGAYDTQCGAKLFRKELIAKIFREPFISKWIFDVELILRSRGYSMIEYPLTSWKDVQGSKFHIFKSGMRALSDLYKIKKQHII